MPELFNLIQQNKKVDKNKLAILVLWFLVNAFFFIKNGIVTTGEAEKYIGQANIFLQTGSVSSPNLWFYFIETGLIAFCIKFHASFLIIIIIQFILNFAATLFFYKTLLFLFDLNSVALAGTIILLLNQPYQEFNTFLQTESLFYSLTLILSCYVIWIEKISLKKIIIVLALLLIASITRPTGLLFILPVFLYLFFIYFHKASRIKKTGILLVFGLLLFFIINKAMGSGGEFDFMLPFRDEDIICGLPSIAHSASIKTTDNGNSILGIFYYVIHNPAQFFRLAWLKTIAFFGLYRSYYSKWHNIYLIVYFYLIHILAIASLPYLAKKMFYKTAYLLSLIFITWLTVMLTCDDWHNRFYLSISPYIIMISMGILSRKIKRAYK